MLRFIRTHLACKVFLSYVVVVLVGVVVLATATSLSVPAAFDRHMAGMGAMMSGLPGRRYRSTFSGSCGSLDRSHSRQFFN